MRTLLLLLCASLSMHFAGPALAADEKGFATMSINLGYLPDATLGERVAVADLADYIKQLEKVLKEALAEEKVAENLDTVVIIKPGGKTRVWLVSSRDEAVDEKDEKRAALRKKLEAVESVKPKGGPVAFCLNGRVAGGVKKELSGVPTIPKEWSKAMAKEKSIADFDKALLVVWPD